MPSLQAKLLNGFLSISGARRQFSNGEQLLAKAVKRRPKEPAEPSAKIKRKYEVSETSRGGARTFVVAPREGGRPLDILFLHGGAYIWDLMSIHWSFITGLVDRLGATITVPLYPLAPEASWQEAHAVAHAAYDDLTKTDSGRSLVLAGDSSGAGLALALAMSLRDTGRRLPVALVLASPWLDVSVSDPTQPVLARNDPMLAIPGLRAAGRSYARDLPLIDPRVSPLFGSLSELPPIAIFTGSRDLLSADAKRLASKADDPNRVRLFEYPGMVHGWMLLPIPEAARALDDAAGFLTERTAPA